MKLSKKLVTGLLGGIAATLFVSSVQAALVTIPVGLNPGDTYRLAFLSSSKTAAISNDPDYYNNFVNSLANTVTALAALGTTWTAIVSTDSQNGTGIHARDNTNTNFTTDTGTGIYLLDGTSKIADNNADLWDGSLLNPININQVGGTVTVQQVTWTGTNTDGTRAGGDGLGGGTDGLVMRGFGLSSNSDWVSEGLVTNTATNRLYAISDILTVAGAPVPAPASLPLFGLGLAALCFARRKRAA